MPRNSGDQIGDLRLLLGRLLREISVPSTHPLKMRVISPFDIPYWWVFRFIPLRRQAMWLRTFRKNVTLTRWTSLSDIYPRPMMLLYFYILFLWARFSGTLEDVLRRPDGCVVGELFIRYICELDRQIDRPQGGHALRHNFRFAQDSATSVALMTEFCTTLGRLQLSADQNYHVLDELQRYATTYLQTMWKVANAAGEAMPFEEVVEDKLAVAGGLWASWGSILGIIYGLETYQVNVGGDMLHAFGMITQIADDMADLPEDATNAQPNLFYTIVAQSPTEMAVLRQQLSSQTDPHLNRRWARANLPHSYYRLASLAQRYYAEIDALDHEDRIRHEVRRFGDALISPGYWE